MVKILVTDDDKMSLMMAKRVLEKKGYQVLTAENGKDCVITLRREKVDLLLLDVEMPGMSGLETLAQIRKDAATADVKTVFLTSYAFQENIVEALRLGALDFVKKPFMADQLYDHVEKALRMGRKSVLLAVDDEPMNLMMTKRIFGIRYQVETAQSGYDALIAVKKIKPDVILLDLHMPGMNGLEVFEKLHKLEGCENIPVVFLTADEDKDTEAKLFKEGASDFIKKPMIPEIAIQRINRIVENRYMQESLKDEVYRKTEALQISNGKVKNLVNQIMFALSGAIDAKDPYTNGHSSRVAKYAKEIASRMGYDGQELEDVYAAGLLHDVGKIGVRDVIINKPGRLTEEEFREIKSHTVIGARILERISELPLLSIGAHWHHERYDGKGYPDGLSGTSIPEIARIVCVADCYDAMTSNRSYRDALPQKVVRGEIEKGLGSQFDPRIGKIMLDMIDEDPEYAMKEN